MKIIFLGTPDFAVPSLEALRVAGYSIVGVVTAPDKPAGRGLQLNCSPVKQWAELHQIPVLQPIKLRDEEFLHQLKALSADIQIVVAFRMLPEQVWNMPPLGTWNLHASLLPQYRGAAPINHAIINGETETGISTFKLVHQIDEGAIALQQVLSIGPNETAGELHDRMMLEGAGLLVETLRSLEAGTLTLTPQESVETVTLKHAPKLNAEFNRIKWDQSVRDVHNHIRGLSPFPTAHSVMQHGTEVTPLKIFRARPFSGVLPLEKPGTVVQPSRFELVVACSDGWLSLEELQFSGKKRLTIRDFLVGFRLSSPCTMQ